MSGVSCKEARLSPRSAGAIPCLALGRMGSLAVKGGLLLLSLTGCTTVSVSDLPRGSLAIAGVGIGDAEPRVVAAIGQPRSRLELPESDGVYDVGLEWSDAEAYFRNGRLEFLKTSRRGHCTGLGLCVGDGVDTVPGRIGCAAEFDRDMGAYSCFDASSGCSIEARIQGKSVGALRLGCLP